ncbi:hypothetical protein [Actinoplanes sp. NPDC049681]|uniref:hypothetical protein n=1 Tax=Actinoplanes sp. NPDC049681 TaxID=3363905 RepID=UPI0037B74672
MQLTPRSTGATDALTAPVADPLWMVGRTWQVNGFRGDDAGTPVKVVLGHTRVATGPPTLQQFVEAEPPPAADRLDRATTVELAMALVRRLREQGVPEAVAELADAFPFAPADAGPGIRPFIGRVPDAGALYQALRSDLVDVSRPGVERACRDWLASLEGRLRPAGAEGDDPPAWDPQRLEYTFGLTATLPAGSVELSAPEYHGLGISWFTFDRGPLDPAGADGVPGPVAEVVPVPVSYPGMPRPRFWELEDGAVNLDALHTDDSPAYRVLADFVHRYANDWFLLPLSVTPGLVVVDTCVVTDSFGIDVSAPPVTGPWRMWELSSEAPTDRLAGARLVLAGAPRPRDGGPTEDVLLIRDELANLAWVVERTTADPDGTLVDRQARYLRLRPPDPAPAAVGDRYLLGTPVPDYWYPLVAAAGPDGRALLALADLPPDASAVDDHGVRGLAVPHRDGTVIADEEVPGEGARLTRRFRLVAAEGRPLLWRARTKEPGLGEGSSGLRFDILRAD